MPSARSSVTPSTHTFRVRILGGFNAPPHARQIWRELELTGDQTLGDLGEAIPLAFGFDDPHLWSFFLSGKPWDEATEYALSPAPDPVGGRRARAADRLRIPDVPAGMEFLFLFDDGLGHARRCQPGTWQRPAGACGPVSAGTTLPSKRSGGPPRWTRRCRPMTSRCGWPRPAR
jgi:hypothetical protein